MPMFRRPVKGICCAATNPRRAAGRWRSPRPPPACPDAWVRGRARTTRPASRGPACRPCRAKRALLRRGSGLPAPCRRRAPRDGARPCRPRAVPPFPARAPRSSARRHRRAVARPREPASSAQAPRPLRAAVPRIPWERTRQGQGRRTRAAFPRRSAITRRNVPQHRLPPQAEMPPSSRNQPQACVPGRAEQRCRPRLCPGGRAGAMGSHLMNEARHD